jgi:hypothetical protein
MRGKEIVDRMRQTATARLYVWRFRHGYDFAANVGRSAAADGEFFFKPAQVSSLCELLRQRLPGTTREIVGSAEKILLHRFDLLGYENLDYGADINWHLDLVHDKRAPRKPWFKVQYLDFNEVGDSKITWELNRHQHLVTLAKAYALTGDERFGREIVLQWRDWQVKNPYPIGVNWASSLEVAFRSVSWTWIYFLLAESPTMTAELRREWRRTVAISGRHIETFLSTYFSPNTHLLGEGVALFFLGTLFRELPHAERWKQRGWKIVLDSMAEQVRPDGFYFEQSTYYHVYALDMFLHARILAELNHIPIPASFEDVLGKMLDALFLISRAGVPVMIGDDDGGRWFDSRRNRAEHMMDPLSTGAVLFKRGDWKSFVGMVREETLWLLGEKGLAEFESLTSCDGSGDSVALRDGGIYLMTDPEIGQQLFVDAGPHGPGHGHADALSVQFIRRGRVLLGDSGTYEYIPNHGERAAYRGTATHNTMRVDGLDQAENVGMFAWGERPSIQVKEWITGRHFNLFQGAHDGYKRLPQPVLHQRWIFHRKEQFWLVRDVAEGRGEHQIELAWRLGGSLSPISTRDNLFADEQESLAFLTAEGHGWAQSAYRGNWSPVYGVQERAMVLTFLWQGELPAEFALLLLPDALNQPLGKMSRMETGSGAIGYRYKGQGQEHHFLFSRGTGGWTLGTWTSDARFLYWSWDREKDQRLLVMCGGSYAESAGQRILTCRRTVDYAEIVSSGSVSEVFSSDPETPVLQQSLGRVEIELVTASDKKASV